VTWNPFRFARRRPARRPIRRTAPALEALEGRLAPSVDVLTFHDDNASTGLNAAEDRLTPANVRVGTFGKLFATAVDGQVYAQPLVAAGVTIAAGVNTTPGSPGAHDVVFVATEHDSLYAVDAGTGAILWQRSFTDLANAGSTPGTDINSTLGATAVGTVPGGDTGSTDISPEVGITGTPVIDRAAGVLYVVVKTKETIGGGDHYVQRLHAVNLADGTDAAVPYLVGDTTSTEANNTAIYAYGGGDGSVADPYNGTGRPVVQFDALRQHDRGALRLVNGALYVPWASHGDNGPYHGWVAKWDVSNVRSAGFRLTGVLNTSPNDGLAGIWQGGGGLVFEPDGSAFYFETGNGSGGAPVLNAGGFPADANYNEALVKVVADPSTGPASQGPNGWGLRVADYFIPYNVDALDGADSDFGSGAPVLLPDSAGIPGHPHLMVAGGKEGKLYVVDRDNLGHFDPSNDHVLNAAPDGAGHNTPPAAVSGLLSTPAWFNGRLYVLAGYGGPGNTFAINADGSLSATSQTAVGSFGYLPGSPTLSASGTANGIAWLMDRDANRIRAYDASTLATELWDSGQKAGGGDNLGAVVKFAVPTVANGEVFVGTSDSLVAYGLPLPASAVPSAPVLSAVALSGSSVNLTWTDATAPPNTAAGYLVEQSTDGSSFAQVTTAPAGAASLAVGGLSPQTTYYFRVRGFNSVGDSAYSNVAGATTTGQAAALDFSGGFAGSAGRLTYNGSAAVNGTRAELTDGGGGEAGSVFSASPVDVTRFSSQFSFQLTAGAGTADGFTFTIQGVGPTALGPAGGGLGYGPDHAGGTGGIGRSVAVKFDLYDNEGEGVDSTGLYTNGAAPTAAGSVDLTGTGVDLHSGDTFDVVLAYDGTTLRVTETDTSTQRSAGQAYAVDIPGTVGGGTAYVGFTGGTGGQTAVQDILTWTYAPSAAVSPNAPSGLGATAASATSVSLNWTNNATNQTGFHLDRAADPGFTQNLLTQTLPAAATSFTDTATGLAPGGTFYYRLRAFNAAGDSGNSNVASVTIPLAPPRPTNQHVTGVTTGEIDLSWQDNAGHQADGYHILRAANHGSFSLVASLPPTSRTPPSTYTWADTGLAPGTFYEYHVVAYNVSGNNDFAGANAVTLTDAPGGLRAAGGSGSVSLAWAAPAGAVGYNVYRGTSPGGEGAAPLAAGVTAAAYTDNAVAGGVTYYYTVTALNGNAAPVPAESAASNEASATPPSNSPPTLPPINGTDAITLPHNQFPFTVALGASSPGGGPLTYTASAAGYSLPFDLRQRYRLQGVGTFTAGATSYVLAGVVNAFGNPYYLLRPADGALFPYDGSGTFNNTQAGTPIAVLGASVYTDPALLTGAAPPVDYPALFAAQQQYRFSVVGLATAGATALVLHSGQPGPGVGGDYLVRPSDGALFPYDGSGTFNNTQAGTPLAVLGAGVAADPAVLLNAQAPPALYAQLYPLDARYDLQEYQGSFYTGTLGHQAEWLYSPVLNDFGQHWYTLAPSPDGTQALLRPWQGYADSATGPVLAALDPAVYAHPEWLTTATAVPDPPPGTAAVDGAGNLTVTRPGGGFVGTYRVTVTVSDGLASTSRTALVTVTDAAPSVAVAQGATAVPPGSTQAVPHGAFPQSYTVTTSDADGDPIGAPAASAATYDLPFALEQRYRFQGLAYATAGAPAYVLKAAGDNAFGNPYYLLRPSDGGLFPYDGSGNFKNTTTAAPLATLGALVYADPSLLTAAEPPVDYATLFAAQQQYQFTAVGPATAGATAFLLHSDQPGPGVKGYYLVRPSDGALFPYDGSGSFNNTTTLTPLATLGAAVAADPSLLVNARAAPHLYARLLQAEQQFDFQGVAYAVLGAPAYVLKAPLNNGHGNPYYLLRADGAVYADDGSGSFAHAFADPANRAAALDPSAFADPTLLTNAKAPLAATGVQATVSGGVLTISSPPSFVGTFQVTVTAGDGFLTGTTSFFVAATDAPPAPAAVADQTASASGPPLRLTLSAADAEGDAVTFAAQAAGYSAAYDLQQQYRFQGLGLVTDAAGVTAYRLQVSGDNGHGNPYYLLRADGAVYADDGSGSFAHAFADPANRVAVLDPSVFNVPTLLTYASAPAPPAASVSVSGSVLTVDVSGLAAGTVFRVFVTADDGAEMMRTSFLVTVTA
jgi:hypothetical protein